MITLSTRPFKPEYISINGDFASHPQIQALTEVMQRRLIMLLCLQAKRYTQGLTDEELAKLLNISEEDLQETKGLFLGHRLINKHWQVRKLNPILDNLVSFHFHRRMW